MFGIMTCQAKNIHLAFDLGFPVHTGTGLAALAAVPGHLLDTIHAPVPVPGHLHLPAGAGTPIPAHALGPGAAASPDPSLVPSLALLLDVISNATLVTGENCPTVRGKRFCQSKD